MPRELSESPPPSPELNRRTFLTAAASLVGLTAAEALVTPLQAQAPAAPEDPTRVPGTPPSPYGQRTPFDQATRLCGGGPGAPQGCVGPTATGNFNSLTPLQALHGIVTPSALHFERHHNGVPLIDPSRHRLLVHGLVRDPMVFTMDDLKRFPSVSRVAFIECSGNSWDLWRDARALTVQQTHGLTSTSEWTGVKLLTILRVVGIKHEATWMLAEGSDAAALARSIPLSPDVAEEALLCYAQNGEALRPEQGYPLRLLVPGWEGNINVKWLRRLKLGAEPFMTRWETAKYTDLMPDGTARQFTLAMEAKSVITSPSGGQQIQPGFVEIRGLAWSGLGRVTMVEVSTDGGKLWEPARLQQPVLPKCHTRFRLPWRWDGQETILQSRCTDETGYVQPRRQDLVAVRGVHSVYHYNAIQTWKVTSDGMVHNVYV